MKPGSSWISDSRIWLGLGLLAFCLVLPVYTSRVTGAIAARQDTAYGTVTDHGTTKFDYWYGYFFFVNGQYFTGWNSSSNNNHAFGMKVLVYYDTQNPHQNAVTDFAEMSRSPFTSVTYWWDQSHHDRLLGGGLVIFLALVGTLTGEAVARGGMAYRDKDPTLYWWIIAIEWLGGLLLIGSYLAS